MGLGNKALTERSSNSPGMQPHGFASLDLRHPSKSVTLLNKVI